MLCRCREATESTEGRNSQLLHKLQKLEQEQEGLVEHSEKLESILGETQIQSKQESKVEGLHQKVSKEWETQGLGFFHSIFFSL